MQIIATYLWSSLFIRVTLQLPLFKCKCKPSSPIKLSVTLPKRIINTGRQIPVDMAETIEKTVNHTSDFEANLKRLK